MRIQGGTKQFHLGDILSVMYDRLVSTRHIGGVYDVLNHMTGDNLFTHQLPRAARECKPWLTDQFPRLAAPEVQVECQGHLPLLLETEHGKANPQAVVAGWLGQMVAQYGEMHEVRALPLAARHIVDPLAELRQMVPEDRIITVETGGTE